MDSDRMIIKKTDNFIFKIPQTSIKIQIKPNSKIIVGKNITKKIKMIPIPKFNQHINNINIINKTKNCYSIKKDNLLNSNKNNTSYETQRNNLNFSFGKINNIKTEPNKQKYNEKNISQSTNKIIINEFFEKTDRSQKNDNFITYNNITNIKSPNDCDIPFIPRDNDIKMIKENFIGNFKNKDRSESLEKALKIYNTIRSVGKLPKKHVILNNSYDNGFNNVPNNLSTISSKNNSTKSGFFVRKLLTEEKYYVDENGNEKILEVKKSMISDKKNETIDNINKTNRNVRNNIKNQRKKKEISLKKNKIKSIPINYHNQEYKTEYNENLPSFNIHINSEIVNRNTSITNSKIPEKLSSKFKKLNITKLNSRITNQKYICHSEREFINSHSKNQELFKVIKCEIHNEEKDNIPKKMVIPSKKNFMKYPKMKKVNSEQYGSYVLNLEKDTNNLTDISQKNIIYGTPNQKYKYIHIRNRNKGILKNIYFPKMPNGASFSMSGSNNNCGYYESKSMSKNNSSILKPTINSRTKNYSIKDPNYFSKIKYERRDGKIQNPDNFIKNSCYYFDKNNIDCKINKTCYAKIRINSPYE